MRRLSVRILLFFCTVLFGLFLVSPSIVRQSAYETVLFCGRILIPSLFPGYVLANLWIAFFSSAKRGYPFGFLSSSSVRCWIVGLFAGFPAAADCAVQAVKDGTMSKDSAERCLAFCNNPGVSFVACAVGGGVFGNYKIGIYLWCVQVLSSLLMGILFAKSDCCISTESCIPDVSLRQILPRSVALSVASILNLCGSVIFFRVLISVVTRAFPDDSVKIFLSGLLEMTCGISQLSVFDLVSAVIASAILGWSGFSVHFQILNVLLTADLSSKYYFPGKGLQAVFSAGLTFLTYPLISEPVKKDFFGRIVFIFILILFLIFLRCRKERLWKTKFLNMKKAD